MFEKRIKYPNYSNFLLNMFEKFSKNPKNFFEKKKIRKKDTLYLACGLEANNFDLVKVKAPSGLLCEHCEHMKKEKKKYSV